MSRSALRGLLVAAATAALASSAHAEIDAGEVYITARTTGGGTVTAAKIRAGLHETWSETWTASGDVWSAADFFVSSLVAAPVRPRVRSARCPAYVQYSFTYAYESSDDVDVRQLIEAAATDPDPTLTDRVLIGGETVGWRIRQRREDGTIDETWLLTEAYAPPRPTPSTAPTDSFQNGWARPYVDRIEVLDAPMEDVLSEAADAADEPVLLARYSYLPRPATPTQVAKVCPR